MSRIWYVCTWSSEGGQRLEGCMLIVQKSYVLYALRTLQNYCECVGGLRTVCILVYKGCSVVADSFLSLMHLTPITALV